MRYKLAWALVITVFLFLAGAAIWRQNSEITSRIRIATGDVSGVYNAYGVSLAGVLKDKMGIPTETLESGGSIENLRLLRAGKAELAFVQSDIMTYAYDGTNLFSTEEAFKDFSVIANLYPEVCQIVARKDVPDIQGLKGRRVSLSNRGSGTELNARQILGAYGLSETDVKAVYLDFSESVKAFKKGDIDAFFCTAGIPTPAILDLAESGEARLLSIGDAHVRALISGYPFYTRHTIELGVYPGILEKTVSVAVQATLIASNKLSENTVFEIARTLFENKQKIAANHGKEGDLNHETAIKGLLIPLHPGAARYFLR
jgi:TRAP transporter TAXI family solute receptor